MSHDDHKQMKIFAATGGHQLAEKMCKHLELPLAEATVECFPDNEIIVKAFGKDFTLTPDTYEHNEYVQQSIGTQIGLKVNTDE